MAAITTPPPIPGEPIDPPPKAAPDKVRQLDARSGAVGTGVGVGYRTLNRFTGAKASLLAAGTTYYLFLAMFAIIAFGYGLAAAFGSEQVATYLTDAIAEAFPGLLGESGIDPAQLRAVGQAMSIVGLVGLLYGGIGGVSAASQSIHLIYGAPADSRNFFLAKARLLAWLALLGPLIALSLAASTVTSDLSATIFDALGLSGQGPTVLFTVVSRLLSAAVSFLTIYLMLSHLGGIRPARSALLTGAAFGTVVTQLLTLVMATLVSFTVDKPQYGALTAPIGILFVLYLQSLALYAAACLTGGVADKDVPLEALTPSSVEEAQKAVDEASSVDEAGSKVPPD